MVTQELFYPCALTCVRLFEPFKLVQKYCGEDSLPFSALDQNSFGKNTDKFLANINGSGLFLQKKGQT